MSLRVRDPRLILLIAAAMLGAAVAFPLGVIASHQFTDVPDSSTYHNDIDAIRDAGITTGCALNLYCPKAYVTREQMAAFLNRLGALEAGKTPVVNAATAADSDTLDGIDSTAFVQGTGGAFADSASADLADVVDPDQNRSVIGTISGLGSFTVGGAVLGPGEDCDITFTNTSGGDLVVDDAANPPIADGVSIELLGTGSRPDSVTRTFSISTPYHTKAAAGQLVVIYGPYGGNVCAGTVTALVSG